MLELAQINETWLEQWWKRSKEKSGQYMHISGQEYINKDGCSYRISIAQSVIEVSLRWEDGFYSYNEEEVIQTLTDDNRITDHL